jgi:oligosaccharyltransferase complex subunit alpha (ribophorin I)
MRPRPLLWVLWSASLGLANTTLRTFENVNVQRTIQLGGALTHVTTIYTVRALGELGPNVYTFALSELDAGRISLFDVKLKGAANTDPLQVTNHGFNPKRCASSA